MAANTISTEMIRFCARFADSLSNMFILSRTVKAQACQKEKKRIALMHKNFAKGEKGLSRSSVAM